MYVRLFIIKIYKESLFATTDVSPNFRKSEDGYYKTHGMNK